MKNLPEQHEQNYILFPETKDMVTKIWKRFNDVNDPNVNDETESVLFTWQRMLKLILLHRKYTIIIIKKKVKKQVKTGKKKVSQS